MSFAWVGLCNLISRATRACTWALLRYCFSTDCDIVLLIRLFLFRDGQRPATAIHRAGDVGTR
ncbi:hypothetical protein BCR44DRAFT_164084 [Catenaria anguillulae PL171]|uniref:Secreted protein n=1 Tax=Catenaria anguillulae PL171 TaxID=765915 RepID=A0A1Y2H6J2_9FUNG|nr:hypothetical protein BCR44DRAFT_164084 [Catenaria anguillulae PL171]